MATAVHAQELDSKQPIEISADTLEVFQNEQKAVFTGNVVANQGNITMQAARMMVFYNNNGQGQGTVKGISRINADGGVFFKSPRETAKGSQAVYEVDKQLISMAGDVVLTRDKNVLKGTYLTYNLSTGRSMLGSGNKLGGSTSGGRVKGLFVPNQGGR
ncbi:MAG: lipopolysaccharide transport periplasmic protein LptA [Rickettsiales bacterium]|nr:lipopolysaccharide transport periplasmic protein LptA [Rickettsiales bacterium]